MSKQSPDPQSKSNEKKDRPVLVTFGRGGHTVYFASKEEVAGSVTHSRLNGYSTPENFFAPRAGRDGQPVEYDHNPDDYQGVPVIDVREAVKTRAGVNMSLNGPMVNPGISGEEIERCPAPHPSFAEALANANPQVGMLVAAQALSRAKDPENPGPFDMVSIKTFKRMWRQAGARIGVIRGMGIEFDDPSKQQRVALPKEDQAEMLLSEGALSAPVVAEAPKPTREKPHAQPEM